MDAQFLSRLQIDDRLSLHPELHIQHLLDLRGKVKLESHSY
jgi:hypothetical protein